MKSFYKIFLSTLLLIMSTGYLITNAQELPKNTSYKGTIINISNEKETEESIYQDILVRLNSGGEIKTNNDSNFTGRLLKYKVGDRVIIQEINIGQENSSRYIITDYNRLPIIVFLFVAFSLSALIIGKKYGLYSLIGLALSFLIIFKFMLPQIINGRSPITVTVIASLFIIPISFYLSHGINKKTNIAIISTIITLIITSIITVIFVRLAKLTGYSSDEAMFLQINNASINMRGILMSGIIIGFLGVLDDVTVSQCAIVLQLKEANKDLGVLDLYKKAMNVGRDHITSMINTLVLVYTGASMPLLLLFINNPQPMFAVLNAELIAEEIVRTLLGSIGLILAVPISTFLASIVYED